ncbi:flagellar export protein FliJ [Tenuibacillus multivorans]|uniref:Flagellar FliJ protein n=1 Tax=Tenuibacillus multivorans TaxID=237069 RepID=A0A1G9Y000_9BACI|nr:flagellar export protein FliJ [Tenuibacillus multivorans]GEL75877.1 hypothetical protein TMU01_01120 [Tenuibacillus multivorans]SDN01971.1 flagellar FliJ protein [Tenuibacillus multivorans]
MNTVYSLEKLYDIKENDFNKAQSQYNRSIEHFEQVGQQLYELLKHKEELETKLGNMVNQRIKVISLSSYHQHLERLKYQENAIQVKVHQARLNMENKQQLMTNAHQEVKKLEKLIEKRHSKQKQITKKAENQFLDDISVQQYIRANG